MARAIRVMAILLAATVAVLVVTGIRLVFEYRPGPPDGIRRAHQVASVVAVNTSFALLVLTLWRRRLRPALLGLACFALVSAASFTGFLLPWDQLALWAVAVGSRFEGVLTPGSDEVRFVLIGGAEVGTATYRRWMLVHTVALPLVPVVAALGWYGGRFLLRR